MKTNEELRMMVAEKLLWYKTLLQFVRRHKWFGYRYVTFCSRHQNYDVNCDICKHGFWSNLKL